MTLRSRLIEAGEPIRFCTMHYARAVDDVECVVSVAIGTDEDELNCRIVEKLLMEPVLRDGGDEED